MKNTLLLLPFVAFLVLTPLSVTPQQEVVVTTATAEIGDLIGKGIKFFCTACPDCCDGGDWW